MSYTRLNEKEPAALFGAMGSIVGFLVLMGADVDTLQSLGTALGIAGTQGALTRPRVYSTETVKELGAPGPVPPGLLPGLLDTGGGPLHQREPALATGAGVLLAGFLVQLFAGVGFTESLASAAGIAGVQWWATRSQVYSPASARRVALSSLIAEAGPNRIPQAALP